MANPVFTSLITLTSLSPVPDGQKLTIDRIPRNFIHNIDFPCIKP